MTRKPQAQIDADRQNFILARKQLIPTGCCNFCGWIVPKLALWCSSGCAQDFAAEKAELLARDGR